MASYVHAANVLHASSVAMVHISVVHSAVAHAAVIHVCVIHYRVIVILVRLFV
jgi:carbonic anhydrase/acetyltransferase-like protein (isoleucine patch superfamily)